MSDLMAMDKSETSNYKEFELENGFLIRQNDKFNAIFKNGKPTKVLKHTSNVYNSLFDFKPRAKSVAMKKDKIHIEFIVETKKHKDHDLKGFCVNAGENNYNFTKKSENVYQVDIPYETIEVPEKRAGIFLFFEDEDGFTFKKKFLSMTGPHNRNQDHRLLFTKVKNFNDHSIYVYETWAGYLTVSYREINVTDSFKEQMKIKLAFLKHKLDFKLKRDVPSIVLFEKFCGKYEESAKYVYQKLIDDGQENVYFILDKDSEYYEKVPDKYKANIINRFSFKHYYEYFNAKSFISTESMNHSVELTTSNELIRRRQMWDDYYYFFLQHGVMYGYSLKGRSEFVKGSGYRNNSFVVVSSEKEAEHFIEEGKFNRSDLIKSGLPKFDHAIQNEDADKILIMPTSRNFEYSTIRDDTKNSTYYNFVKKIIESVPHELKDKIIFVPHPLVMEIFKKSDLKKYMSYESSYDEVLKDTRLLITDYSSISFDAFYRGCNVIFAWMEKEMCLEKLGMELKLNDGNAFADIAYEYDSLGEMILKNYDSKHSEENEKRFEELVEYNDGKNTERFINYLYDTNAFPKKDVKYNINDSIATNIEDYPYSGKKIRIKNLNLSYDGKKLVKNLDYTEKYKNNKMVGKAKAIIKGKGIYFGEKEIDFEIKRNIAKCKFEMNGDDLSVSIDDASLSNGEDYIYEWKEYEGLDLKKIIIKGIGEFRGEKSILMDTSKK